MLGGGDCKTIIYNQSKTYINAFIFYNSIIQISTIFRIHCPIVIAVRQRSQLTDIWMWKNIIQGQKFQLLVHHDICFTIVFPSYVVGRYSWNTSKQTTWCLKVLIMKCYISFIRQYFMKKAAQTKKFEYRYSSQMVLTKLLRIATTARHNVWQFAGILY